MKKIFCGLSVELFFLISSPMAMSYDYWTMTFSPSWNTEYGSVKFGSAQEACDAWVAWIESNWIESVEPVVKEGSGTCYATGNGQSGKYGNVIGHVFPVCQPPTVYNEATEYCEVECPLDKPWDENTRQCLPSEEPNNCLNQAGNPINFLTGHKLQRESLFQANGAFPLTFSWLYNSFGNHHKGESGYEPMKSRPGVDIETILHTEAPLGDGENRIKLPLSGDSNRSYTGDAVNHWRHSHSYYLSYFKLHEGFGDRVVLYRPNGRNLYFLNTGEVYRNRGNPSWRLTLDRDEDGNREGWTLVTNDRVEFYNGEGQVLRQENYTGVGINYEYDEETGQQKRIVHDHGDTVDLIYENRRLNRIVRNDKDVYRFSYDPNGLLVSIFFGLGYNEERKFHYEDSRFPRALTGVTDESGERYSTYIYDVEGRAISSEHGVGVDSINVEYVSENVRTLTNALGKKATYRYGSVGGSKLIESIEGEASMYCAAANRSYSYDSNGFITSQTDWKGNLTTFVRDSLGRELSRTESAGTPLARVTRTEWHSYLNLKTKIITDSKITVMTYSDSGRLISKTVQATNPR